MTLAKIFKLKGLLKIFHDIESREVKILETDPNLGKSMTTHRHGKGGHSTL